MYNHSTIMVAAGSLCMTITLAGVYSKGPRREANRISLYQVAGVDAYYPRGVIRI
jgi:hypothetical protein